MCRATRLKYYDIIRYQTLKYHGWKWVMWYMAGFLHFYIIFLSRPLLHWLPHLGSIQGIPEGATIHTSAIQRMQYDTTYWPKNLISRRDRRRLITTKKKKNTRCELGYDTIGWIDIFHIGVFILLIKTKTTHSSEVRYWWYVHSQTYSVEVHLGWEFLGYIMTDRAWENWIEMLQTLRTRLSSLCLPLVRQVHPSTFLISRSDEANFSHPQNLISDRRRV